MSRLNRDDVLKLARLSRLRLSRQEVESFASEISAILDYVETLDKVDTQGLKPTSQVTGLINVMRRDEIIEYRAKPVDLLSGAPSTEENQFKVKRVIE